MIEIEEKVNKEAAVDQGVEGEVLHISNTEEEVNILKMGNILMLIRKVKEWKEKIISIDIDIKLLKIMIIFKLRILMMGL